MTTFFTALFGIVITALGLGLLGLVCWSLKTRVTYYGGPPLRRVYFRRNRTTFLWALVGTLIFGALITYVGISVFRLAFR